jgi:hypothetical protein
MLQAAARVAKNVEAETRAYEIRMRAARKTGELSKKIEKASGNQYASADRPLKQDVLKEAGISHQEASEWERLAAVPKDEFEAALAAKSVRGMRNPPCLAWRRKHAQGRARRQQQTTRGSARPKCAEANQTVVDECNGLMRLVAILQLLETTDPPIRISRPNTRVGECTFAGGPAGLNSNPIPPFGCH